MLYYIVTFLLSALLLFLIRNKRIQHLILAFFAILQISFTIFTYQNINYTDLQYFKYDAIGVLFLLTATLLTVPLLFHGYQYLKTHVETGLSRSIFYSAMVLLIGSISAGYLTGHIAVFWIFIELTTLSASALIYHHRTKLALEGTWKYIFICTLSITFIFIGILFLQLSAIGTGIEQLSFDALDQQKELLNPFWLKMAFLFIFTGLTVKMGLFPMFTAGVDAKDKAPAPAAAILSGILINLGFIGFLRLYHLISGTQIQHWADIIVISTAIVSLFISTIYMIKIDNLKRLFAYSGVEHAAIASIGIVIGGIGYYAALLHLVIHALIKSALFLQFTQVFRVFKSKYISQTGNYFKYNKQGALVLLTGFFALSAVPPSGLFISEFLIFQSLAEKNHWYLFAFLMIMLVLIAWSFGSKIFQLLFVPSQNQSNSDDVTCYWWESLSQWFLLLLAIYLGFSPPQFFNELITEAAKWINTIN